MFKWLFVQNKEKNDFDDSDIKYQCPIKNCHINSGIGYQTMGQLTHMK